VSVFGDNCLEIGRDAIDLTPVAGMGIAAEVKAHRHKKT
jgi:hypothetical protein